MHRIFELEFLARLVLTVRTAEAVVIFIAVGMLSLMFIAKLFTRLGEIILTRIWVHPAGGTRQPTNKLAENFDGVVNIAP
jgi:hypothetical protein